MSESEKKRCAERVVATLRDLFRQETLLSKEELAARFEDDGYVGTAMREMILTDA